MVAGVFVALALVWACAYWFGYDEAWLSDTISYDELVALFRFALLVVLLWACVIRLVRESQSWEVLGAWVLWLWLVYAVKCHWRRTQT